MAENPDSAAFAATVGLSRAERAQQARREARETLARSRGNEFRDADEPLGVPEPRPRDRRAPLASRGRTPPAPQLEVPTWAEERDAVFEAITALRVLGETLTERVAELRQAQTREHGMLGAWRALKQWGEEECAGIETAGRGRDDHEQEPFELPPLRALRQS